MLMAFTEERPTIGRERYLMAKQPALEHPFNSTLMEILEKHFGRDVTQEVFAASPLIGYINNKTRSANRGSKARGAFASHYAIYVIIEDYIAKGFAKAENRGSYKNYEGAKFSDLFKRQRELPFGAKLQNHALNSRVNDEFRKFFPLIGKQPIVRDVATQRYWIQEDLLLIEIRKADGALEIFNIAPAIIEIIDAYVATKRAAFEGFLEACKQIAELGEKDPTQAVDFVKSQLQPNVDARIFEIVSYAVLKSKYGKESIWIGATRQTVEEEFLVLYKTGRTNANDGGIDFVMKPLGRFFQVTETVDVTKYFLDIDKVQRFPITFVVKTDEPGAAIIAKIRAQAVSKYKITAVVESYMKAIEEVINTEILTSTFSELVDSGKLSEVMDEIVTQSKVEFNYGEDGGLELEAELF